MARRGSATDVVDACRELDARQEGIEQRLATDVELEGHTGSSAEKDDEAVLKNSPEALRILMTSDPDGFHA